MYESNPSNLGKWLENPPARKPGTLMLNLGLSPQQISNLVAYLQSLK